MAPLPKRRLSHARQGKRRQAIKLNLNAVVSCPSCGQPKLSHRICPNCGTYNKKVIIKPKQIKNKEK